MNRDLKDNPPLISKKKFVPTDQVPKNGSSPIRRWFLDENGHKWLGKCSLATLDSAPFFGKHYYTANFSDYKEHLAMKLYSLFGITTPETVLSLQDLHPQDLKQFSGYFEDLDKPRIHIMSKYLDEFQELGNEFINSYKNKTHYPLSEREQQNLPLRGFGKVIIVTILLHDFDCVGNSGGNMGFIPNYEKKYAEIAKIDPGEALSFADDMSLAEDLNNPVKNREALISTNGTRLKYSELTQDDQNELLQAAKEILKMPDSKIEEVFQEFLVLDYRFRIILDELLKRKKDLLSAFSPEVRTLIMIQMKALELQEADVISTKWGQSTEPYARQEVREKADLILENARLRAINIEKNQYFVGRIHELEQIKKIFANNHGVIACAIVGGPGLGKSQLAAEYLNRNHESFYSQVIWLHSEHTELISDQIQIYLQTCFADKPCSEKKNKEAIIKRFYQILNTASADPNKKNRGRYCVVFDNAKSMTQIAEFLPEPEIFPGLNIDIIITSRYQKWEAPFYTKIEVKGFEIAETQNYISKVLLNVEMGHSKEGISKEIVRFNELLGGHPLAISQALAYIQQKRMNISRFCDLVSESNTHSKISTKESEKPLENLEFISPTLTLALAEIRSKNQKVEYLLDLIAYLSPEDINEKLLHEGWMLYHKENKESNTKEFNNVLDLLASYSIVNKIEQNTVKEPENAPNNEDYGMEIKIHRLTQQVIRLNHEKSGIYNKCYNKVFAWVLVSLGYNSNDMKDAQRASRFVTHGMQLEKLSGNIEEQNMSEMFVRIGSNQSFLGKYDVAKNYYEKALAIIEKYQGRDHPKIGKLLKNLGTAWGDLGNYEKQKDILSRSVKILEKNYGKCHPITADALQELGYAWGDLGFYEKQKDYLTLAFAISEKCYGRDHPYTADILASLGSAWGDLGNYENQKDLLTQSLEITAKYYGKDHIHYGFVLHQLGIAWGNLLKYQQKIDLLTQALAIDEKYYGKDHVQVGGILGNLGNAYGSLGNYEEQKKFSMRAIEIFKKHYGEQHPQTGFGLVGLGKALTGLGEYEKGKNILNQALEIYERHYGNDHPQTAVVLMSLGVAWGHLGNNEKKKVFCTRTVEIYEKHYGSNHLNVAEALHCLAEAYGSMGIYSIQKDLLTRVLGIEEKCSSTEPSHLAMTLNSLGGIWGRLGNYEQMKEYSTRALEIVEKHYGIDYPEAGIILNNLGQAWGFLGNHEEQKAILNKALRINEKNYGKNHPSTGYTLSCLANACDNHEESIDLLTQALEIFEKHYGKDHPETGEILHTLGRVWGELGNYEKMKDAFIQAHRIFERAYGADHLETVKALTGLGVAMGYLGDHENQEVLLTKALEITKKHSGIDHPDTVQVLISLARIWKSRGKYEKQKEFVLRALEIAEKAYGEDRPETGKVLTHLTDACSKLGDRMKCEELSIRIIKIYEKHYGKEHLKTGIALENLGRCWRSLSDFKKVIAYSTKALEIYERHYGNNSLETGAVLNNLGIAWGELKNHEKKKDFLTRALDFFVKFLGKDHIETGILLNNLGTAWGLLGRYEKQKDYLIQAIQIYKKNYGTDHPSVGLVSYNLAVSWLFLGEYLKSKELASEALRIYQKYYPGNHLQVLAAQKVLKNSNEYIANGRKFPSHLRSMTAANNSSTQHSSSSQLTNHYQRRDWLTDKLKSHLNKTNASNKKVILFRVMIGNAHGFFKNYQEQILFLTQVQEECEKIYGKRHPLSSLISFNLATAFGRMKNYKQQESLLKQALETLQQEFRASHPLIGIIMINISAACLKMDDTSGYLQHRKEAQEIFKKYFGESHSFTKYSMKK